MENNFTSITGNKKGNFERIILGNTRDNRRDMSTEKVCTKIQPFYSNIQKSETV